jgi:hypothetical protein
MKYLFLILLFSFSCFGYTSTATMTVDDFRPEIKDIFIEIDGSQVEIDIYVEDPNDYSDIEQVQIKITSSEGKDLSEYQPAEFVSGSGTTAQYQYQLSMEDAEEGFYKVNILVSDRESIVEDNKLFSYPESGLGAVTGAFAGADSSRVLNILKTIAGWFTGLFS